ncbi:MAG TPA: glutamine synthetase family protein [Spirochaetota bacterium]|nr:glutamine synthetase family protein [Spirochaetota bacterium]HPJ35633.1 glutamine synthetase family protein [Spirochaetota bacterium]
MEKDKEYILKFAHENKIKFIRLWFTDILGFLKSFAITIEELDDAINEGVRFDGSTLQGYIRSDEEEMFAVPDVSTFQMLPWRPQEDSVARMFCDIYRRDMKPFEGDSRYILKKNLQKASAKGLTYYTGPEIEFFFFKNSERPEILDQGGYFDLTPLDVASDYRRQLVLTLEKMGIDVISSHHEGSYSQHEIDLRHEDALTTADNIMTFKLIAKEIGQLNNIYASFMPKPLMGQNGSGLHIHQSLFRDDENIFFNPSNENYLSYEGRHFIAGLLRHANEFTIITNQWINSYKRLVAGYESPTHATWSPKSQSALVRIPQSRLDKPSSMRVELRSPDPACNPYLAFSAMLAAGLKGIEEKYELPEPYLSSKNSEDLKKHLPLPMQLNEALTYFSESQLMKDTLGDFIHSMIIENKMYEQEQFNRYITDYEITTYLSKL